MNIANIFGLHLGCRIKFKQSSSDNYTGIGHLSAVKNGWVEISVDPDDTRLWYDCSDCKLILKPLSKITDEEKRSLWKSFISTRRQESNSVAYTYQQALFLSTKGYKVDGIVPDEYCEVEE